MSNDIDYLNARPTARLIYRHFSHLENNTHNDFQELSNNLSIPLGSQTITGLFATHGSSWHKKGARQSRFQNRGIFQRFT